MALYLVTGGAGFIGSALVHELLNRCEQVRVVDNFFTGKRENLADVWNRIDFRELDITELEPLRPAFESVDYVLHQAALPSVPRSVEDPITSNRVNIDGTLNVLVAARDAKVKRLVYAASSSAYGDTPTLPKHEQMLTAPISPYGVTKLVGELYANVFTTVYGLETVCLRYFNVFGPRQDPSSPYSGVLSKFISSLLDGQAPTIYGDGQQSRDFTFVQDTVEANLLACKAPDASGKTFNIATGERKTLLNSFQLLHRLIVPDGTRIEPEYAPARAGDILHSQADITLARQVLGYESKVSFEEGLRRTVEWYRSQTPALFSAG
ncbi:MAG: SDR family oxidoreductase [Acidobacteria bacterium]|nr:SDR family oxidoreductase [Acidobacteriota bacterium]